MFNGFTVVNIMDWLCRAIRPRVVVLMGVTDTAILCVHIFGLNTQHKNSACVRVQEDCRTIYFYVHKNHICLDKDTTLIPEAKYSRLGNT